jgi:anti-sigma regulatory factor (Ser/Thr protein kinase)
MQDLTLSADLDNLKQIRDYVKVASVATGMDDRASYNLQLAVDEIATNIITHGYLESGIQGSIILRSEVIPEGLRITLEDTGVEFDPTTRIVDESDLSRPLEERAMGGLGIFLALQGVDNFSYKRINDRNYNIFEMHHKK